MKKMNLFVKLVSISMILVVGTKATEPTQLKTIQGQSARSKALPPYLVYRHFLAWVNELDESATASDPGDFYKFAEPFSRANLQHEHLDILRDAAHRLDQDLKKHQARAQVIIDHYRKQAKQALAQGQPLPPAPAEIRNLERERTALLIHHYVTVRAALGPDISAQLDRYLGYEFTPHIKLRLLSKPGAPSASPEGS
jgi:hypothetical protein